MVNVSTQCFGCTDNFDIWNKPFKAWMLFKSVTHALKGSLYKSFIVFTNSCIQNCKTDCMHVFLILDQTHNTAPNSASRGHVLIVPAVSFYTWINVMWMWWPALLRSIAVFAVFVFTLQNSSSIRWELLVWFSHILHLHDTQVAFSILCSLGPEWTMAQGTR